MGIHAGIRSPGRRGRTGWNGNRTTSGPTTSSATRRLFDRAVMKGHRLRLVAAGWVKLRAA